MEALLVNEIPRGEQWEYEPKWDGFRCLAFRDKQKVELFIVFDLLVDGAGKELVDEPLPQTSRQPGEVCQKISGEEPEHRTVAQNRQLCRSAEVAFLRGP